MPRVVLSSMQRELIRRPLVDFFGVDVKQVLVTFLILHGPFLKYLTQMRFEETRNINYAAIAYGVRLIENLCLS